MREVYADLVHAARLGTRLDERHAVAPHEHLHARQGADAVRVDGLPGEGPLLGVGVVDAREPRVDVELLPRGLALDDGEVPLVDKVTPEGLGEHLLPKGAARDDAEPRRHAVEAVHWLHAGAEALDGDVEERRTRHAAPGHHGHAGRLREHRVVRTLVDEEDGLGIDAGPRCAHAPAVRDCAQGRNRCAGLT